MDGRTPDSALRGSAMPLSPGTCCIAAPGLRYPYSFYFHPHHTFLFSSPSHSHTIHITQNACGTSEALLRVAIVTMGPHSGSDDAGLSQYATRLQAKSPQLLFFLSNSCTTCAALEAQIPSLPCSVPVTRIRADADHVWAPEVRLNMAAAKCACMCKFLLMHIMCYIMHTMWIHARTLI